MKWKPSASARREFAARMQDPEQKREYENRKSDKAAKRRSKSKFDYDTAGGNYAPTQIQYDYAMIHHDENPAVCDMIILGYTCQETVQHDYIHILNEMMRGQ